MVDLLEARTYAVAIEVVGVRHLCRNVETFCDGIAAVEGTM
jgi:hypothetical protein